jgi:hypothetical protein
MSDIVRPDTHPDRRPAPPPGVAQPVHGQSLVAEYGMATVGARHAGAVIAIGMALLGLLNAQGLWNWASRLPANPLSEIVFAASQFWLDLMDKIGPTDVMTALRNAFEYLRNF